MELLKLRETVNNHDIDINTLKEILNNMKNSTPAAASTVSSNDVILLRNRVMKYLIINIKYRLNTLKRV